MDELQEATLHYNLRNLMEGLRGSDETVAQLKATLEGFLARLEAVQADLASMRPQVEAMASQINVSLEPLPPPASTFVPPVEESPVVEPTWQRPRDPSRARTAQEEARHQAERARVEAAQQVETVRQANRTRIDAAMQAEEERLRTAEAERVQKAQAEHRSQATPRRSTGGASEPESDKEKA